MWQSSLESYRRRSQKLSTCAVLVIVILVLASCASTTRTLSTGEQIVLGMQEMGADVANVRPVPMPGRQGEKLTESLGFDIPGIDIKDKPAGTIRVYRRERDATFSAQLAKMLGKPGPTTKLDYVTVRGTRELVLDHHLPEDLAQRYISAFRSTPEGGGS